MNTPGVSIFQGGDTLKVNSTLERQEEEEALQDQKRREEELGNLLENAFDDLNEEDEESTMDSTTHFPSNILPVQPLPQLPPQPPQKMDYNEMHKLKMLLESQNHQLQTVNKMAMDANNKIDDYQKRLSIAQAELDRALREKQHTHELLVESKEKCSNLDNNIEKLRSEKKLVESENTQLVGQLETAQALLADVQRKYDLVERDQNRREDRNIDMRIKQLEEHHRAQSELMQQQLSQLSDQLDKKKQELDQMHMRYQSLQQSHESMVLDKASKINELNSALDVAQRRYNQLSSQPSYESEYIRQQKCISDLHEQVASRDKTIAQLTERLNGATAEMDLMDTLIQQHQTESETPSRLPSHLMGSTPLNPVDRMGHIKQELYRALGNLKTKREEVRRLEKQLDERTHELRQLRDEENKNLIQLATLKEDKTRLETRIKVLQDQLEERQHNSSLNVSKLQSELDTLIAERDTLLQQTDSHNMERERLNKQLKELQTNMDKLQQEHEHLKCNHDQLTEDNHQLRMRATADDVRLELERHRILLKDAQGEVKRLKTLYTEIANEKETLSYQLRKMNDKDNLKELQEQRQQIAQLQRNVQLAELKAQELSKILETEKTRHERELQTLREKWERETHDEVLKAAKESSSNCKKCIIQLEEITKIEIQMLKLQNLNSMQAKELDELKGEQEKLKALHSELQNKLQQAAVQEKQLNELKAKTQQYEEQLQREASQPSPVSSHNEHDGSAPTSPELTQVRIKRIEQRVRDEMAKLFAAELKRFTVRAQQLEERNQRLQREYQLVSRELQKRQTEVELLTQTILAEREQMQDMLGEKDEKQKHLVQKCRNELQAKNQRIADLLRELDEQHASIDSERRSMKAVMAEWDKQKQSIEEVEQHWRDQVKALHDKHEEELCAAEKRYQSAKRTAHNYKLYSEAKDAHMKSEYERIKQEYQTSLSQIEAKMQEHLQRKRREQAPKNTNNKENQPSNH